MDHEETELKVISRRKIQLYLEKKLNTDLSFTVFIVLWAVTNR